MLHYSTKVFLSTIQFLDLFGAQRNMETCVGRLGILQALGAKYSND